MEDQYSLLDIHTYIEEVRRRNEEFALRAGRRPICYSHSYGCQQNVADGEKLNGLLAEMGYDFADKAQGADFILYNTCAVRENAEDRIFGNVGALKHQKLRNPDLIIALCGCMMQQKHVAEKIRKSYPYVDLLFGANAMHQLPGLLARRLREGSRAFLLDEVPDHVAEGLPARRDGKVKAWLPIMHGCDNFCSYCVVPLVRGREVSREPRAVLDEARGLIAQGYREITLLGQNVNSYGRGLAEKVDFAWLLREMDALPGQFRIRFMTSHPKDCTRELIDTIASCEKVCRHIHLPVQSGSDRILKLMNRSYTSSSYLELIDYAKEKIPGVTFTSDIMVGFPGETYEDFGRTLELVRRVEYQSLFTFLYSKREGTAAAKMEDPISKEEKHRWFNELLAEQNKIGVRHHRRLVGKTIPVLMEGTGKTSDRALCGRSESNIIVEAEGAEKLAGELVNVEITQALNWAVLGEIKQ